MNWSTQYEEEIRRLAQRVYHEEDFTIFDATQAMVEYSEAEMTSTEAMLRLNRAFALYMVQQHGQQAE